MNKKPMYWPIYSASVLALGLMFFYSIGGFALLLLNVDIYTWLGINNSLLWLLTWLSAFLLGAWGTIVLFGGYYPAKLVEARMYRAAKRALRAYDA
jgi:uncharacterized SAM-binding protein YcdF (DUF218 family)